MTMRVILMGTGPFAGPAFEALIQSPDYEVLALYTRPKAVHHKGRKGQKAPPPNPMRQLAEQHGVPVYEPASINDNAAIEQLRSLAADVMVVCDYGQILKPATLEATRLGGINLHGSLLPKYRGAAPVHWAIWDGEQVTGITVIHMTPKLDGGPSLTRADTAIGPEETTEQLEPRLAQLGVQPVFDALQMLAEWDGSSSLGESQDSSLTTKAPRLSKSDGRLDWSQPAQRVQCQFRALQPWPGVYTTVPHPKQPIRLLVKSLSVEAVDGEYGAPGEVVHNDGTTLGVAAGQGVIRLTRVQPAGKREMDTAEFLRGHSLPPGIILGKDDR